MASSLRTYINRDYSWLSFNGRVLQEAADPSLPLYNRFLFLSIFSSNLDEFFRVRMPAIFAFTGLHTKKISLQEEYPDGMVEQVQTVVAGQLDEFGQILRGSLLPALREKGIHLCYGEELPAGQAELRKQYFLSTLLSFLQPVWLNKANREKVFPENNALYFIVQLQPSLSGNEIQYALLNIPSAQVSRFTEWPLLNGEKQLTFIDDLVRENLDTVFRDFKVAAAWSVKLTRNAEMNLEDEFDGDIAEKIEKQLEKRDKGPATRLLVYASMPVSIQEFVRDYFGLDQREVVAGGRYHNLKDFSGLPLPKTPEFMQQGWPGIAHPGFDTRETIFDCIRRQNLLLHIPYHSYSPVLRFFNEAAVDPRVKEIYITLYRVAADSHIVNALISAARNGKQVVVFVELKARFDEANNLKWSKRMKAAGIKIVYSIPRLKVHAKTALIIREENGMRKMYSYLGTGNFNEVTARFYTDHSYLTADPATGEELYLLFTYLQSRVQPKLYGRIPFKQLLVSRFNMIKVFTQLIRFEIIQAKAGNPASITIKLNNLQEREMIDLLYEASNAGVKIQLLVRGICCLAAGVKGQSEHITVTRIVDRYLEHARVFIFHNAGDPLYYLGSADWMKRNLHSRIEVCFPLTDAHLKAEIDTIIRLQLQDNIKAIRLDENSMQVRVKNNEAPLEAQQAIYQYVQHTI